MNETAAPSSFNSGAMLGEVMVALLAVLFLIVVLGWVLKRMGQGSFLSTGPMKVVASLSLGTREKVVVLDINGEQILLGITAQQITRLHSFDEAVIAQATQEKPVDFSQKLKQFMQKDQA